MSGCSSLFSHKNEAISLLRLGSSILGCFSRVGFSSGVVKQSKRDDYASHEPFGVTGEFLLLNSQYFPEYF